MKMNGLGEKGGAENYFSLEFRSASHCFSFVTFFTTFIGPIDNPARTAPPHLKPTTHSLEIDTYISRAMVL